MSDAAGYYKDPKSLTVGSGLLSLAALIPGVPRPSAWSGALRAAKKADLSLSGDAAKAINGWVGGGPDFAENARAGFGIMSPTALERASPETLGALSSQFSPVREALRKEFGDTVPLFRGSTKNSIGRNAPGGLLSWSLDPRVAERFAGGKAAKLISDAEIADAVAKYNKSGFVKFRGLTYKRTADGTPLIYRGREVLTDADSIEQALKWEQDFAREAAEGQAKAARMVEKKDVPLDDIVWVTNRFGQKEAIVRNR